MGSPQQPPTPSSFSPFGASVTPLAAAPPGRDGSTAVSLPLDDNRDEKQKEGILQIIKNSDVVSEKAAPHDETCLAQVADEKVCSKRIFIVVLQGQFDDNRDEKQKEGILQIIKNSDVVSKKAARHDETCLAQVADEEECSEHNLSPLAGQIRDFRTVLKGCAQEGRSEHNHLDIILDSGASMHATGNLRLLSEFTRAPGGSSVAVYHTRDGKDLRIAGAGKIACDKFHLPHVHYVPELGSRCTLASVQLLAGCDYLVMFCGGWCYVKNRNNGSLVGRGRMHDEDGLYHLEYLRIPLVLVDGAN